MARTRPGGQFPEFFAPPRLGDDLGVALLVDSGTRPLVCKDDSWTQTTETGDSASVRPTEAQPPAKP